MTLDRRVPRRRRLAACALTHELVPKIAVVIPCLDEERTIAKVVGDMKAVLPGAEIVDVRQRIERSHRGARRGVRRRA
jgi:hypothetical protein